MEFKGLMCLVFMVIVIVALANEDEHSSLLYSNYNTNEVRSVHTTGGSVNTLTSLGHPLGITYDHNSRTVYAVHEDPNGISSFPVDNPGTLTTVTDLPSGNPRDITVDTVRRHLYVSDTSNHVIYRLDTDGGNMLTWVKTERGVYAVKVAEMSGYVYWAEHVHDTIMRASVTDAAQKEVFIYNTEYPYGLYIDEVVNTIYWCEHWTGKVKSAAVDRSHQRTITTISEAFVLYRMSGLPGHLFVIGFRSSVGVIYDISIQEGTYTQLQTNDRINPWFIVAIQNMNDSCLSNPCHHDGSCYFTWHGYVCVCPSGYNGDNCELDIDECASSPCLNRPICVDAIDSYMCTCDDGYTGAYCDTNINECASSPCLNGAICKDGVDSYMCTCDDGYTGAHCETNINECASSPCMNDGHCDDNINRFTCHCHLGYTGQLCDKECEPGSWDLYCKSKCGHCYGGEPCNKVTGECTNCQDGYLLPLCTDCASGYWNVSCNSRCGHCYGGKPCNTVTGECERCEDGYNTPLCTDCAPGYWNVSCNSICGHCYGGEPCNTVTGECERCEEGYNTSLCTVILSDSSDDNIKNIIIPVIVVVVVVSILVGVVRVIWLCLRCRVRRRLHRTGTADEREGVGMHPIEGTEAGVPAREGKEPGVPAREGKEPGVPAREGKEEARYHGGGNHLYSTDVVCAVEVECPTDTLENELSPIKVKDDERDEDSTHSTEQASAAVYSNEITKNDIDDPYGDESDLTSDVLCTNEIIKNYIDDPYGDESDLTSDVFCTNEIIENYIDDPYGDESDLTSDALDETH